MDDDWKLHFSQFNSLCEEYQTDPSTRLKHFGHSLQHKSQDYHYYQALGKDDYITWEDICNAFDKRYHSWKKELCSVVN